MVTIWFKYPTLSRWLNVDVDSVCAGDVWDSLAKEFEMRSTRP